MFKLYKPESQTHEEVKTDQRKHKHKCVISQITTDQGNTKKALPGKFFELSFIRHVYVVGLVEQ